MSAHLIPLHIGPEKEINVFVHGFGYVGRRDQLETLTTKILSARPAGRVYLLFWYPGNWKTPRWVLAAGRLALRGGGPISLPVALVGELPSRANLFKYWESKAEDLGRNLKRHLSKIPHARRYPINLIGHSLGARVIHWALAANDWSDYKLQDCVLLGGAANAEDEDWPDCLDEITGKIHVAYSDQDRWLQLKPDLEYSIGRHGILWRHPRIINRKYKLGHLDYWNKLEYILERLWKGFHQAEKPLLACPECEGTGMVTCEECDDDYEVPCEGCDADGTLDCGDCDGKGYVACEECDDNGEVPCQDCKGSGAVMCGYCGGEGCGHCDDEGERECRSCDGDGIVWCGNCDEDMEVPCETCEGEGEVNCDTCDGEGYLPCEECNDDGEVECEECEGTGDYTP
jgi:hypothetical protein